MTDKQAYKSIKDLADYCNDHIACKGCIFKPKEYKPATNECMLGFTPADVAAQLKKERGESL